MSKSSALASTEATMFYQAAPAFAQRKGPARSTRPFDFCGMPNHCRRWLSLPEFPAPQRIIAPIRAAAEWAMMEAIEVRRVAALADTGNGAAVGPKILPTRRPMRA